MHMREEGAVCTVSDSEVRGIDLLVLFFQSLGCFWLRSAFVAISPTISYVSIFEHSNVSIVTLVEHIYSASLKLSYFSDQNVSV